MRMISEKLLAGAEVSFGVSPTWTEIGLIEISFL